MKPGKSLFVLPLLLLVIFSCARTENTGGAEKKTIEQWAEEFQPTALSRQEQLNELEWFAQAAEPLKGLEIRTVAEGITTHYWESEVLARAFYDITGIKVVHEIIGEGEVVERIGAQIASGEKIYDAYVNDADMIGTHVRADSALNIIDYMKGDGKAFTNPGLDLEDFLNLEFGQDYDGNQLQLPDQQFANLYWFRYDWFTDPEIKADFQREYGYELGVPVNWAAYEDIARFFTGRTIDGNRVYGHMDYGKISASLGWRFTDAWLSMAGVGDKGLPNGIPVDEWGIRVEDKIPRGASVSRGGAANSPAAVYALTKYVEWLDLYAPPYAKYMSWSEAGAVPANGKIAQRIFQYITWLSAPEFNDPSSPVTDSQGNPLWRVAPSPHGRYWDEGMKVGYQDAGSWTILKGSVEGEYRAAAWLWAQFCVSKSVSLKKFLVGRTPVRKSTVFSSYLAEEEAKGTYGGIITFYKSPVENRWTDSGPNVPHYPSLSRLWWLNVATAISGEKTPDQAMDNLARQMDETMEALDLPLYSPELNEERSGDYWLNQPGSPKPYRERETPVTVDYDELVAQWR